MRKSVVTSSSALPSARRAHPRAVAVALGSAAFATYLAVTATAFTQRVTGSALFQGQDQATLAVGGPPSSRTALPRAGRPEIPANELPPGTPMVLTITVDGAFGSFDVYCATTTTRAPFDRVHASPEDALDVFHQRCSEPTSEWS